MASAPPPPTPAPTGEVLAGRYRLERRIGQGGMAEVWVATDADLDRKVAVKLLKSNLAADPVVAERFRREAIAVARLNHPNIVAVHDVIAHQGRQGVVMQLIDGKSLRQLLDGQQRLGPELTIHIGAGIAAALDAAHRGGFVHRDVKPGNILVTSDGRVLLTDFGIAKGLQPGDDDLTSDNVMMGTAKYLSPEQVRGRRLDGRADLYSLGLVLYECLAGRVPFLGETDADTALARLQRDPTDLGHLRPTLPIGLVNLIHTTLARNPAHRPQSGSELRNALLKVDTSPPEIDGTPAELPARLANPPKRALGAGPGVPGDPHLSMTVANRSQGPRSSSKPNRSRSGAAGSSGSRRAPRPDTPGHDGSASPGRDGDTSRPDHRSAEPTTSPDPARERDDPTPPAGGEAPTGRAGRERRDPTPPAGVRPRGVPARGNEQRWTSSLVVVGGLIVLALIVAVVLLVRLNRGDTIDPPDQTAAGATGALDTVDTSVASADGPVRIVGVSAWDPDGSNGSENDEQAELALADGIVSSAWATECYQDRYLGGKRGVGLIVSLSAPSSGRVTLETLNAPYQIELRGTDAAEPPSDPDSWVTLGERAFADEPGPLEFDVDMSATHVLVWMRELGADGECSTANPYRGRVGEIAFNP